jgi:hypothetical protein
MFCATYISASCGLSTPHSFCFRVRCCECGVPWQRLLKVPEGKLFSRLSPFHNPSISWLFEGHFDIQEALMSSNAMPPHSIVGGDSPGDSRPPSSHRRRVKHACDNCGSARTKCDGKLPWLVSPLVCSKNSRATAGG